MMRRRIARPYGQSISMIRMASMLMSLVVLWALYQRLKDPAMWRVFAGDKDSAVAAEAVIEPETEQLVPGSNDQDETEIAAIQDLFAMVTDRTALKPREMAAYWRLMSWSRTEPFAQLKERAKSDIPFTKLWDQPDQYRGKPIELRLHVRRVLEYDAPENPLGIAKVYEAWGWTDESKSFPYVVVFPERPPGLPVGTDVRAEVDFVGYFLKVMTYTAFDNPRGAPLLVGRMRLLSTPKVTSAGSSDIGSLLLVVVGGICLVAFIVWAGFRPRAKSKVSMLPGELSSLTTETPISTASLTQSESSKGENPFDLKWGEESD